MASTHVQLKVGVLDSGAGGLTVLSALLKSNHKYEYHYFADDAFAPYGNLTIDRMRTRLEKICRFMIKSGVNVLVIACNTATLSAISYIRNLPCVVDNKIIVVGVEPAVKPASLMLESGVVSVLATPVSCDSHRLRALIQNNLRIEKSSSDAFVKYHCIASHILAKAIDELPNSQQVVEQELLRIKDILVSMNSKVLVLACTHYPLIMPMFESLLGPSISIVEPSQAVADRMLARIEQELDLEEAIESQQNLYLYSSARKADVVRLYSWLEDLLGQARMAKWVVFNKANCIQD